MKPTAESSERVSHSINKCVYIAINSHSFALHPIFMFWKSVQTVKDEWMVIKRKVKLNIWTSSAFVWSYLHANLGWLYSWNNFHGMKSWRPCEGEKADWKVNLLYLDIPMKHKNSWYHTVRFGEKLFHVRVILVLHAFPNWSAFHLFKIHFY